MTFAQVIALQHHTAYMFNVESRRSQVNFTLTIYSIKVSWNQERGWQSRIGKIMSYRTLCVLALMFLRSYFTGNMEKINTLYQFPGFLSLAPGVALVSQ